MPQIKDRSEENARRKSRLAKMRRGPGVFVYDGSLCDTEWIPTPALTGKKEALFDSSGLPAMDASGRQIYQQSGRPVIGHDGKILMGGTPKMVRKPIETYLLRGMAFPKGEPVEVEDSGLALKLRGMDGFTEVEAVEIVEEDEAPVAPKKKGGRPKKVDAPEIEATEGDKE